MTETELTLIPDFDLSGRNTLALKAASRFGVVLETTESIAALFALAEARGLPLRILGGGSNVVLAPEFDGITAIIASKGKFLVENTDGHVVVEAAAGEVWHDFVGWTVAQGFGGIENLAGIPGTVGAAPVQNIGAYGAEVADVFESLVAFDTKTRSLRTFALDECAFAYRDSVFKHEPGRYVVVSLRLRLKKPWTPNLRFAGLSELADLPRLDPKAVMERVVAIRNSKLPDWRVTPNAGSFFQNPIVSLEEVTPLLARFPNAPNFSQADGRTKLSAGWLIEQSGLKGFRLGKAGVSDRHALVVINLGGAAAEDIAALAAHIKATVMERFGIALHEEPVFT
ncbi:UDP-N-acetylenolpyruvoylglucosamine reductase [Devosia soli]|uniref:UDP-N-acetylenolpyruvoylglucosamine reductase n=1 Tax=Devosia soli TaxID=361041 RepID=A0A0F5L1E8_9HYPH|nr:UDP-N-acetylmuramate dehydrogenase [Devosia soli]KKB76019.1 UDP-N-acetylenolpyruvoylglucosamine reductase [Devosia soli]